MKIIFKIRIIGNNDSNDIVVHTDYIFLSHLATDIEHVNATTKNHLFPPVSVSDVLHETRRWETAPLPTFRSSLPVEYKEASRKYRVGLLAATQS